MGVATEGRVEALLATDEHAEVIAAFYRDAWGQEATAHAVVESRRRAAAENVAAPGQAPPTALVLDAGRVIGYCGSIGQRLWDGVAEHPAYWVKGLMVLPAYRSGPIGFLVVKQLAALLPRAAALVVAPAARRLFGAVGFADLGAATNWVRPLRGGRLAQRIDVAGLGLGLPRWIVAGAELTQRSGLATLAGAAVGVGLGLMAATTDRAAARIATAQDREAPSRAELDALWLEARGALEASPVRDGRYIRGRFDGEGDGNPYAFVTARHGGRLLGVAVVRRPRVSGDPRLRGVRLGTVSELVFPPERADVGMTLLGAAARVARTAGADALLCTTSHRAVATLLRRQGYLRVPGNVHLLVHDRTATAPRWPSDVASWWLARGDSDADDVF